MVLTEENLEQIEIHMTEILPKILTRNPDIATTIEGILAQHFPRRDEFARLLDEVYEARQEMGGLRQRMDNLDENVNKLRGEMNERFKEVDKNFLHVRRDIVKLQSGQDSLTKRMDDQQRWFNFITGNTRLEKGESAEDLVALALRYGLGNDDIDPNTIRLRQPIRDPEGLVFHPGYKSDIDLIACNGTATLFEVKFGYIKNSDPGSFAQRLKLFKLQNPDLNVKGLLISPGADDEILEQCQIANIQLLR